MKIFGRTPGEYLRSAAVPLAVLSAFMILRVDLYRHSWLRSDAPWMPFAYEVTLLFFIVRVRLTRFGDFKTLLPLFTLTTATLGIVDGANRLFGRRTPDNSLGTEGVGLGVLGLTLMMLVHWALGSGLLAVLATRARMVLAGVFVLLFLAPMLHGFGIVVPFAAMVVGAVALLVRLVLPKETKGSTRLRYAGSLVMIAFTATCVGGTTACQQQYGDQQTADKLVGAIETYHQAHGQYPESLEALVPDPLPALPALRFGQHEFPYFYGREEGSFHLAFPVGFRASRVYHSGTKEWEGID